MPPNIQIIEYLKYNLLTIQILSINEKGPKSFKYL